MNYSATEIIGLDLSLTRTGIAMVDGCDSIKSGLAGMARLQHIRDQILAACGARTRLAIVEGYSMGGQRGSAGNGQRIGELGGIVRLALFEHGVHVVDVPPTVVKKWATGNGRATKDEMKTAADADLSWPVANHDEADAAWLRTIGLYASESLSVPANPYRDEIAARVRSNEPAWVAA